ncbi:DUF4861 family protein [Ancylomarina sp. 16SWW S1-10-2]|uniref:DUF4861 family protein n=1 Tax=Ancylomarina sp. 16SWW S1-10-2 TaxID=2499681 RepID=UPI0012AE7EBE|nr:DUF4861 family protein [Ancylomarina sp. 16SWW S1-10-2]MRT94329.1 DUF4861 domain-containing protein [Ancylomarina sp. 16SWW S1-10-2]
MKSILLFLLLFVSTQEKSYQHQPNKGQSSVVIEVENPISLIRKSETITLSAAFIKKALPHEKVNFIQVRDLKSNTLLTTQPIDYNEDGIPDIFLFQTDFDPNEKKEFELSKLKKEHLSSSKVYVSYMPSEEGMEDFTWENDFIGYRFYGQERAQKQGTGIAMDIWCKRVPDFLTNKWYAPSQSYHIDKGYGADHYSSGKNQGCGGSGIFKNDSIYFSKPFSDWKIIAKGPIRVVFELKFTGWTLNNDIIETKRITLDAGHYFNKIESRYNSDIASLGYEHAVGFVQRDDSDTKIAQNSGWITSWESLGKANGNLGTGFIASAKDIIEIKNFNNHIISLMNPKPEIGISYYVGASWDEFGSVNSKKEWTLFVENRATLIKNPCKLSIKQQ